MRRVVKVRYIKNDEYSYECDDADIAANNFVWCKVKCPKTGQEYEQLAIVVKVCDAHEENIIRRELEAKGKELKKARKHKGPPGGRGNNV